MKLMLSISATGASHPPTALCHCLDMELLLWFTAWLCVLLTSCRSVRMMKKLSNSGWDLTRRAEITSHTGCTWMCIAFATPIAKTPTAEHYKL